MKYENAGEILPVELLQKVQKYAAGKLLYVPSGSEKKAWGEASGSRERLRKRNILIRNKYDNGRTVSELADEYFLSLDSIKKIIYGNKNERHLVYEPTIASAVQYANVGMLEEWMECYLQLTEKVVKEEHMIEDQLYFGVVKFPLRLIQFEEVQLEECEVDQHSANQKPLIIQYESREFYCLLQSNQLALLKSRKINAYPTIVMLQNNREYKRFMKYYGRVLFFVDG